MCIFKLFFFSLLAVFTQFLRAFGYTPNEPSETFVCTQGERTIKERPTSQSVRLMPVIKCFVPLASSRPPTSPLLKTKAGIIEKGNDSRKIAFFFFFFVRETLWSTRGRKAESNVRGRDRSESRKDGIDRKQMVTGGIKGLWIRLSPLLEPCPFHLQGPLLNEPCGFFQC